MTFITTALCALTLTNPAQLQPKQLRALAMMPMYHAQMVSFDGLMESADRLYAAFADRVEKKIANGSVTNEEILKLSSKTPRASGLS